MDQHPYLPAASATQLEGADRVGRVAACQVLMAGLRLCLTMLIMASPTLFGAGQASAEAPTPTIWFAPTFATLNNSRGIHGPPDYLSLFTDQPSVWPTTSREVRVFKIYQGVVHDLSENAIAALFAGIKSYNMALAIEYGMMTPGPNCGQGLEGYFGRFAADTARKIKRLGGDLAYLAMDEPLWYGAYFGGVRGCRRSVESVAQDVAQHVSEVRQIFPNVQVGDIEPMPQLQVPDWPDRVGQWAEEFRRATGRPLAFLHCDVVWDKDWRARLSSLNQVMRRLNVPLGVIVNGTAYDQSDEAWTNNALTHLEQVLADGINPAAYVFQSWNNFPSRVGPETTQGTMTNLILRYLKGNGPDRSSINSYR
jgi:hypothetical protein